MQSSWTSNTFRCKLSFVIKWRCLVGLVWANFMVSRINQYYPSPFLCCTSSITWRNVICGKTKYCSVCVLYRSVSCPKFITLTVHVQYSNAQKVRTGVGQVEVVLCAQYLSSEMDSFSLGTVHKFCYVKSEGTARAGPLQQGEKQLEEKSATLFMDSPWMAGKGLFSCVRRPSRLAL